MIDLLKSAVRIVVEFAYTEFSIGMIVFLIIPLAGYAGFAAFDRIDRRLHSNSKVWAWLLAVPLAGLISILVTAPVVIGFAWMRFSPKWLHELLSFCVTAALFRFSLYASLFSFFPKPRLAVGLLLGLEGLGVLTTTLGLLGVGFGRIGTADALQVFYGSAVSLVVVIWLTSPTKDSTMAGR